MMPPCLATSSKMPRDGRRARGSGNVVKILKLAMPSCDRLADLADRLRRHLARQDVVEGEVGVGVAAEDVAPPLDGLARWTRGARRVGGEVQVAGEVDDRRHPAKGRRAAGRLRAAGS